MSGTKCLPERPPATERNRKLVSREAACTRRLEGGEAVGGPGFGADAVVDEEQAGGVVLLFDLREAGVIGAPVGMLPILFEEIAFGDVGSAVGGDGAEFVHAAMDLLAGFAGGGSVGFVAAHAGIAAFAFGDDGEREGIQHSRIGGSVSRCFDGFARASSEAFIEMQADEIVAR